MIRCLRLRPGRPESTSLTYFCADGECPAVIGSVMVYRDNYMTNSFARTRIPFGEDARTLKESARPKGHREHAEAAALL